MSNHQKGYSRDSSIISDIEECGILDTEQIRLLRFKGLKYGRRIAQKRLLSLHKRGRISRTRLSIGHPYYYYIGKQGRQVDHRLGVNWIRVWMTTKLETWERLHSFDYEADYGILRADGFAAVKNKMSGAFKFYFVEFDNAASGNAFDKVGKYNKLYEKQPAVWWKDLTGRFPAVIIVTTSTARAEVIREKIKRENANGLEFKVYSLDRIIRECEHGT